MTKYLSLLAGTALLTLVNIGSDASAVVMQAVLTGTVIDDATTNQPAVDGLSFFGLGTNLNGVAVTIQLTYDTATPGSVRTTNPNKDDVSGTSSFSNGQPILSSNPVLSGSITINGKTQVITPSPSSPFSKSFGYVGLVNSASNIRTQYFIDNIGSGPTSADTTFKQIQIDGLVPAGSVPLNLDAEFSVALLPPISRSLFAIYDYKAPSPIGQVAKIYGALNLTTLAVTKVGAVSPVPVPAALPLLAGALGAVGVVARRKKAKAAR